MKLRKIVSVACLLACLSLASADENAQRIDAESLVDSWMSIKELVLGAPDLVPAGSQELLAKISDQVVQFQASPLYLFAKTYTPELESNTDKLRKDIRLLSFLLREGHLSRDVLMVTGTIDLHVMHILVCKYNFIKQINLNYINIIYMFLALCLFVIFLIVMNRRTILSAERGEAYATAYARSVVRAHEDERKKLARELHDTIVQDMTSMKLRTETLYYAITKDTRLYDDSFESLISHEQTGIENIRTVCYELRPPELDYLDLKAAVSELCSHFELQTGIRTHFESSGGFNLSGDEETNIFRIIQESLANVGKHSRATEALVSLSSDGGRKLSVAVRDNGIGFDAGALNLSRGPTPRNFGLKGINERVDILSGTLQIDSGAGKGTNVIVCIPLTVS